MSHDRPKTAPRGFGRAFYWILNIISNFDSSWVQSWSILGPLWGAKKLGWLVPCWVRNRSFLACCFCVVLDRLQDGPRAAQEAPRPPQDPLKRLQEAAKRVPGGPKRPPRVPQEAPRGPPETPRAGQEGSLLRSPKSTYPKGLASNRGMKKGGRAAVMPLGASQYGASPCGHTCWMTAYLMSLFEFSEF